MIIVVVAQIVTLCFIEFPYKAEDFITTTTKDMQKFLARQYGHNWEGSLNFEKVEIYLPYFKSAIQVPIYVIGIDI